MTPAARLRSACYDSMALLTMAHQPPASSNLSTRPRSCPMRSTWVRVRVRVRVKVRVRVSYPNPNPNEAVLEPALAASALPAAHAEALGVEQQRAALEALREWLGVGGANPPP